MIMMPALLVVKVIRVDTILLLLLLLLLIFVLLFVLMLLDLFF